MSGASPAEAGALSSYECLVFACSALFFGRCRRGLGELVGLVLVLDLAVLNRRSHALSVREAMYWSGGLVTLAHLFAVYLLWQEGTQHALEFYTGYLIELSLSVDNLFVFILVFQYFGVPAELQPRVLKWGILGAIVMRLIMIMAGALLLERFHWIIYVFGAFLVFTGIRMAFQDELERCETLGIRGLVIHPGAHTGSGEEAGIAAVALSHLPITSR